jgi:hypothetical protein
MIIALSFPLYSNTFRAFVYYRRSAGETGFAGALKCLIFVAKLCGFVKMKTVRDERAVAEGKGNRESLKS